MKSKKSDALEEVRRWKRSAARELEGLKGKALVRELRRTVRAAEKESGVRLARYRGAPATPRLLRRAQ